MSLPTQEKVEKLQQALHAKAKRSPEFRFYSLYDKMYRSDVLWLAWERCRENGGAAGVDGETFEQIAEYGAERWREELASELRTKEYRTSAVRRVWIEKAGGGTRPLGIPTIRDRVVQTAMLLVIEPIFEADLEPEQHAYREGKSAHEAVRAVHTLVNNGHTEVVDADLSGYFDSIPHPELMKSVARRISDKQILRLIKMWLTVPVEEFDDRGTGHRTTRSKDERRGTPQGAPVSPLLSNLYMRRFVLGWKRLGYAQRFGARIVNYADDFVICCRGHAEQACEAMRAIMQRIRLTVNEEKTRVCRLPEHSFDFLGYTIGRCYSPKTGRAYIGTRPRAKAVAAARDRIRKLTERRWTSRSLEGQVELINRILIGWSNYFCLGPVSSAYHALDEYACDRLRQWLRAKHKVRGRGMTRYPNAYLHREVGLVRLTARTRGLSWAKA